MSSDKMVATKTSIEIEDLDDLRVFCTRRKLTLKQFVNRSIRNEMERLGIEPEDRTIRVDDPGPLPEDGMEKGEEAPTESEPISENPPEESEQKISEKNFGSENPSASSMTMIDSEAPGDVWKCPTCGRRHDLTVESNLDLEKCKNCGEPKGEEA